MNYMKNTFSVMSLLAFVVLVFGGVPAHVFGATLSLNIDIPPDVDTYVASGERDLSRDGEPGIWVGHDTDSLKERRTLLKFRLSDIPPASQITSADLLMTSAATTLDDSPLNITVFRLLSDFGGNITWAGHEGIGTDPARSNATVVTTSFQEYTWNVKSLIEAWYADTGQTPFLGLLLKGDRTSGAHRRGFWADECTGSGCAESEKPKLRIAYEETDLTLNISPETTSVGTAILPDEQVTVTITYTNGPVPISSVKISGRIPTGFEVVEESDGATNDGKNITWELSALAANESDNYTYSFKPLPETDGQNIGFNARATWETNTTPGQVVSNSVLINPTNFLFGPVVLTP